MKFFMLLLTSALLQLAFTASAEEQTSFETSLKLKISSQFSQEEIKEGLERAVWTQDKKAIATCFNTTMLTKCFASISSQVEPIDITQAFKASLGKITIHTDSFTKYKAYPIRFIYDNSGFLIEFKTHAWIEQQRHIVKWMMAIKEDGTPIYQ